MVNLMHSTFSNGLKNSYINVKGADLAMTNVTLEIADSDSKANGRGVKCTNCLSVNITNSTFDALGGYQGGAVYLEDSSNGYMEGNTFHSNTARQGGAIYIYNSQLTVQNSTFLDNRAVSISNETLNMLSYTTDMGAGGAIFFTCVDLSEELSNYVETGAEKYKEPCAVDDKKCLKKVVILPSYDQGNFTDAIAATDIKVTTNYDSCELILKQNSFSGNGADGNGADSNGDTIFWTNKLVKFVDN